MAPGPGLDPPLAYIDEITRFDWLEHTAVHSIRYHPRTIIEGTYDLLWQVCIGLLGS